MSLLKISDFRFSNNQITKSTHQRITELTIKQINASTHQRITESTIKQLNLFFSLSTLCLFVSSSFDFKTYFTYNPITLISVKLRFPVVNDPVSVFHLISIAWPSATVAIACNEIFDDEIFEDMILTDSGNKTPFW